MKKKIKLIVIQNHFSLLVLQVKEVKKDKEDEEDVPPAELELRERIGGHRADQDDQDGGDQGYDQTVQKPARRVRCREDADVVFQIELLREPVRRHFENLGGIFESIADQPVKREQVQNGKKGDQNQQDDFTGSDALDTVFSTHGLFPP